jgi:hypothetical protein
MSLGSPATLVPLGLHRKPHDFNLPLPSEAERVEMSEWDQDGSLWKEWRKATPTIGSSSMGTHLAVDTEYRDLRAYLEHLRGNLFTGEPGAGFNSIPLMMGHLMEPNNKLIFCRFMAERFGVRVSVRDVGVIFHPGHPNENSSLDGLVSSEAPPLVLVPGGEEVDLNRAIIECKCVLRKKYQSYPEIYMPQQQRQLAVARAQELPQLAHFSGRTHSFMAVLEVPYRNIEDIEGRERLTIEGGLPWILKVWLTQHSPEYEAWCELMFSELRHAFFTHPNTKERPFRYSEALVRARPRPPVWFLGTYEAGALGEDLTLEQIGNLSSLRLSWDPKDPHRLHLLPVERPTEDDLALFSYADHLA